MTGLTVSAVNHLTTFVGTHLPITTVSIAALLIAYLIYPLYCGPLRDIPGPLLSKISNLPLLWYDIRLTRNEQILAWHQRYGPIVCIGPNEISVASLEDTRTIYSAGSRFEKSSYFDHFSQYQARSVFATKPHGEHSRRRKYTSAFYQASNIYNSKYIADRVRDRALAVLLHIEKEYNTSTRQAEVDVYSLSDWFATDIITYLVLGPTHCSQLLESDCFERWVLKGLKYLQLWGPFRFRFPSLFACIRQILTTLSPRYNYLNAEDQLSDWSLDKFQKTQQDSSVYGSDSLVRRLLVADDEKRSLGHDFIAAEVLDNINAAEATVCVTAAYMIWSLAENPIWQDKLRQELSQIDCLTDGLPSFAEVDSVPVLEACLREVFRLYPAQSGRSERIIPDPGHMLANHYVPGKTVVTASFPALHRNPELFPDAQKFDPSRWLVGDEVELKHRADHLLPFGYGERICLGKALANMEIKLFTTALCSRFKVLPTIQSTVSAMKQMSTHDAVPRSLGCIVNLQKAEL